MPIPPRLLLAAVLAGSAPAAVAQNTPGAQSAIFECVDAKGGRTFTNMPADPKACKRRDDLAPLITVPAAPKGAAAGTPPRTDQRSQAPNFPRVEPEAQKARDGDRRRILEDELRREQARLAELRAEFNNGEPERRGDERNYARYLERVERLRDDIRRSEGNIASLQREIGLPR